MHDGGGRLLYAPEPDYFNCEDDDDGGRACGDGDATAHADAGTAAAPATGRARLPPLRPDAVSFCVVDESGLRSANVSHLVWVRGAPDAPLLLGAGRLAAEVLALTSLPPLRAVAPDGAWAVWEVELSLRHGVLSLNQSALEPLRFRQGDGTPAAVETHATSRHCVAPLRPTLPSSDATSRQACRSLAPHARYPAQPS